MPGISNKDQKRINKLFERYRQCTQKVPPSPGSVTAEGMRQCEIYLNEALAIAYGRRY